MYESRAFRQRLGSMLAEHHFDLVHVDSLDLSAYLPDLQDLPVVCVHHDVESRLLARRAALEGRTWRGRYLAHQARLMEREERFWCRKVTLNVVVSQTDADSIQAIAPGCTVSVVPNGVDVDEFQPAPGSNDRIVYVGGTTWFPNLDALDHFCEDILPRLRAARPAVTRIQWVGFATPEQQRYYRERFDVELTGYVPDVRPYMRESICSVVPLRVGGGTRIKILNAWAMGNAVVSTSIGCEGLDTRDGDNILIADNPDAFAGAVLRVLDDPSLRELLGARGRATAEQVYGWDVIGAGMADAYLRAARSET
jgi:glycosyltransferase involved in cell wall biosynthesis